MSGAVPWQEVLLLLGAAVIWYLGVAVLYRIKWGNVLVAVWTFGFYGFCILTYVYLITRSP